MIGTLLDRLYEEIRRIWCYRWLAAGVAAAIMAAVAAYVATLPTTYEAWGQIYVNPQTPLTAAAEGVSLVGENYGSPYVVQKTLLNDESLSSVARRLNGDQPMSQDELAGAVAGLRGRIRVTDGGDGFVEIHYTDADPVRAQQVTRLLLDEFIARNIARSQNDLSRAGAFLDEQIASYQAMISQSQAAISAFRRRYPGSAPGSDAATVELVADTAPAGSAPSAAAQRAAQLEGQLATLLTSYTDRHPDVVAARRQLAEARAESQREAASASAAPVQTRRVVRRRAPTPLPPQAAAELAELTRKDEMLRNNYQQLIAKRAAAQMSQDVYGADRGGKYQITRQPVVPTSPLGPDHRLYLAGGLVLALGAGLGAAYLRAAMRGILISAREVEEVMELPVIGTVSWEPAWRARPRFPASFNAAAGHASRARTPRLRLNLQMEDA